MSIEKLVVDEPTKTHYLYQNSRGLESLQKLINSEAATGAYPTVGRDLILGILSEDERSDAPLR